MKWVKHDTDANQDAKLQTVLLDYGLEGYGLYWYCIELIAGKIDGDNISFELEHDARIIARNTGSTPQKVEEMMKRFVSLGLFEQSEGVVTCLKIAKRLDKSMTSNSAMRGLIESLRLKSHDSIMTESAKPMQEENRLDKNRLDKNRGEENRLDKKQNRVKYKYSESDLILANQLADGVGGVFIGIRERFPEQQINIDEWANAIRMLVGADGYDKNLIQPLWAWISKHSSGSFSWSDQIRTPMKLRQKNKDGIKYFSVLDAQARRDMEPPVPRVTRRPTNGQIQEEQSQMAIAAYNREHGITSSHQDLDNEGKIL